MAHADFEKRRRRILRRHRRLSRGAEPYIDSTGLVTYRPRRASLFAPLRGLLLIAVGFIGFKGLVLAHLGAPLYEERLELLRGGTVVEQAGAWAMQADPASVWVAARIAPYID